MSVDMLSTHLLICVIDMLSTHLLTCVMNMLLTHLARSALCSNALSFLTEQFLGGTQIKLEIVFVDELHALWKPMR